MSKSSAKLLILLLVSLMIIGIATGIISDSQRRRRDAENLLVTARPFVVGTTTLATAQKELKAYQSYGNKKMVCNATDCTLSYEITNRWLHVLRLAPGTGFGIVLWFRNGILQRKDMYLGHDLCCVIFVREYNSESVTSERSKYKEPTVKLSQDGTGLVVKARIGSGLSPMVSTFYA